jgi:hypothetical protein
MAYTFAQLVEFAKQAGFPADQAPTAAAVALAESSGNAGASHVNSNGSTDFGLWEINSVHRALLAGKNWRDPVVNAQMAFQVWHDAGGKWTPWSTYKSGAYTKYLNGNPVGAAGTGASLGSASGTISGGSDPFAGVTAALDGISTSFQSVAGVANVAAKLALPQTWVRIMSGVFGAILLGFGLVMLTREIKKEG